MMSKSSSPSNLTTPWPASKIQLIRQLLREFDACDDEAALKKRYLQLRVARAAAATANLSQQDRRRRLDAQRAAVADEIAAVQGRIAQLEGTMRQRTGRTLARAALDKCRAAVDAVRGETATTLRRQLPPLHLSLQPTAASVVRRLGRTEPNRLIVRLDNDIGLTAQHGSHSGHRHCCSPLWGDGQSSKAAPRRNVL